ncbi:MAG TPA: acyltransferase family protein [Acidimicrobiales bacterium]|nr:acyltransferase family protein [Acidimicrobiales bacterium]
MTTDTIAEPDTRKIWPALDGLRAVAVVLVILTHLPMRTWRAGYIGVDVFFCLSGFLITNVIATDAARAGRVDIRRFYLRRVARLYPALLLALGVAAVLVLLSDELGVRSFLLDAVSSLFYVFNVRLAVERMASPIGQFWSLSVEEQFYIVWAPLMLLLHRRFQLGTRAFWAVAAGFIALVVAKLVWALTAPPRTGVTLYPLLVAHADELLLGAMIALALHNGLLARLPDFVRRSGVLAAAALVTLCLCAWQLRDRPDPWLVGGGWLLFAALGAIVIVHVLSTERSFVTRFLSLRPLRWIGVRSYGIYLFHVAIIRGVFELVDERLAVVAPVGVGATLVAAGLSWRFVEQPVLRLRDRTREAAAPGASTVGARAPLPAPTWSADLAVGMHGVGKLYRQTVDEPTMLKQLARTVTGRRGVTELWALRDIDLEVRQGETIGVIGRNGSGKTTMLRLLSGVSAPTVGRLRVVGSIAPLIGVGVGFNAELTGRENVYANGQILGIPKQQLARDFDEIIAFAELEKFVDTPVKFYSSGMFLRLAFAVAIQLEPEVMLVDEVLAVGDQAFQAKCFERMQNLQSRGTTIVVVTHNLSMLGQLCDRAVLLSKGAKVFDGGLQEALSEYQQVMRREDAERVATHGLLAQQGNEQLFAGGAHVSATLVGEDGETATSVRSGARLGLRVHVDFDHPVSNPTMGFRVGGGRYPGLYMANTLIGEYSGEHGPERPLDAVVWFETPLLDGGYRVDLHVFDADGEFIIGSAPSQAFYVVESGRAVGVADLRCSFEVGGRVVADRSAPRRTSSTSAAS